jgi:hypothetical protein
VVRVAGDVGSDITVSHAGTVDLEASLRAGEVLHYVRSGELAARVARILGQARPLCAPLPALVGFSGCTCRCGWDWSG